MIFIVSGGFVFHFLTFFLCVLRVYKVKAALSSDLQRHHPVALNRDDATTFALDKVPTVAPFSEIVLVTPNNSLATIKHRRFTLALLNSPFQEIL